MIIRSRAPLRLGFGGGGTDVVPYCTEFGGVTLSAAINVYAYATWKKQNNSITKINAPDVQLKKKIENLSLYENTNLIETTLKKLKVPIGGEFCIHCEAPPGSGLGTSSAVNVALIGVIWDGTGRGIASPLNLASTKYDIANLAYEIERKELGIQGGYQDQFASSFGGFNWIEYRKDGSVHVSPLRVSNSFKNELQARILLCFTGKVRVSGKLQDELKKNLEKKQNVECLHKIKEYAYKMKEALEKEDIDEFARYIDLSWQEKRKVSDGVTNEFLDKIYDTAKKNGAIGGKVSGAGGGGFMYFIVKEPIQKLTLLKELQKVAIDYETTISKLPVRFEDRGIYTWRARE